MKISHRHPRLYGRILSPQELCQELTQSYWDCNNVLL